MLTPRMGERRATLNIPIAGGDTAHVYNLRKRVALVERAVHGLTGKRVLDCGCGAGSYAAEYSALGAQVVGIEYNRSKLLAAVRRSGAQPLLVVGDLAQLPLTAAGFDVAVLNEVLEHVPNEARVLAEVRRVLKVGGVLLVMSPNRLYPFESHGVALKHSRRAVPRYVPLLPYIPLWLGMRAFDYWARNYWPWELQALIRGAGFEIVQTGYVAQTFENISGAQPALIRGLRPLLRAIVEAGEGMPLLRNVLSVSQLVIARKP